MRERIGTTVGGSTGDITVQGLSGQVSNALQVPADTLPHHSSHGSPTGPSSSVVDFHDSLENKPIVSSENITWGCPRRTPHPATMV